MCAPSPSEAGGPEDPQTPPPPSLTTQVLPAAVPLQLAMAPLAAAPVLDMRRGRTPSVRRASGNSRGRGRAGLSEGLGLGVVLTSLGTESVGSM